ncbi:MAG: hypothetical protein AAFX54_12390 [Pseudomonadota bacterium]
MNKRHFTLDLIIDADQITRALHYQVNGDQGTPFQRSGPLAGTFHFKAGDEVTVNVRVISNKKDNVQVAVTDFTLASIPTLAVAHAKRNYLSMFDCDKAVVNVSSWGLPERREYREENGDEKIEITIKALHSFTVVAPSGQWRMSGYLSALIRKGVQTEPTPCMFYFDPEGSSGSGGDIVE